MKWWMLFAASALIDLFAIFGALVAGILLYAHLALGAI